jgi:predicted phosphodiesterase
MIRLSFLTRTGLLGLAGLAFPIILDAEPKIKYPYQETVCKLLDLIKQRRIIHRFVTAGDGHWFDHHITTAHKRLGKWANNLFYTNRHDSMIQWMNYEANTDGVDFIVFNGDLATNKPEQLPIIKEQYDRLNNKYYVVHGNHDHSSDSHWKSIWGDSLNHSFEFDDYACILLNSANEQGDYLCADHEWLSKQLTLYKGKTGILIFCHIFQHGTENSMGVDCKEVTQLLLDTENVKMVVYSHKHLLNGHFPIFKSLDDGGRQLDTFFTGHFSSWGLPYLGYRVIEIYEDRKIGTYALNPATANVLNWNEIP